MKIYTPDTVERDVAAGASLCVLDNLVLDLHKTNIPIFTYDKIHPGGKFILWKNYGRDISKFFYGGYSMVNPGMKAHTHSFAALKISKSLIVGVLEDQDLVKEVPMKLTKSTPVNAMSSTFTFTHTQEIAVPNFKKWYSDLNMIGRHFLVCSSVDPHTKRQYTICSTMQP